MSQKLISLIYEGLLKSEINNRKMDRRYEQQDHRKRNKQHVTLKYEKMFNITHNKLKSTEMVSHLIGWQNSKFYYYLLAIQNLDSKGQITHFHKHTNLQGKKRKLEVEKKAFEQKKFELYFKCEIWTLYGS